MFAVVIHEKGGQPRRQEFNKNEVTIGRVQGNDIILPKQNVSKRHSRIVVKDGKFIIVDLKSTNGTYVNGRKIASPMVIKQSDKIYIGDFILSAEPLEGADAEPAAAQAAPPEPAKAPPPPPRPKAPPPAPAPRAVPPPAPAAPAPAPVAPRPVPTPAPAAPPPAPAPVAAPRAPAPVAAPPAPAPVAPAAPIAPAAPAAPAGPVAPAAPAAPIAPAPVLQAAAIAPTAAPAGASAADAVGDSPLAALLGDASVQRITVNGTRGVFATRAGKTAPESMAFGSSTEVYEAAHQLLSAAGVAVAPGAAFAEGTLSDGTRVHVALAAAGGPYLTVDRPGAGLNTLEGMVEAEVLSKGMAEFLQLAFSAGRNIIIASNDVDARLELISAIVASSGDTRVIALDAGGRLAATASTVSLSGGDPVSLVNHALKMRPDRLVVSDGRGAETFTVLTALAGSVNGGILGLDAESTDDAMIRLVRQASLALNAADDKVEALVREAADVIVQLLRYADGRACITQVLDVDGELQEVFSGLGAFQASGHVPRWVSNAQSLGHAVDMTIFS